MATPRRLTWGLASVVLLMLGSAPAWAAHPPKPTSINQPVRDGCLRSNFGTGFNTAPEWVYVYRNPTMRMATGVVRVSHQSSTDSILEHRSFDFNANLVPDRPFQYLIAGSRAGRTNNYAPGGGEEQGRLHFEWESATLPQFAWPTDGDRATIWGSWIWDCGHWQSGSENNTGGATTGEHSELHPLSAIAVRRRAPYLAAHGESQTDVFVSNMGDGAHAVEWCALSHHPVSGGAYPQYDAGFHTCAMNPANRIQPLARSYTFFVPAPRRPSRTARLRYRIVSRIRGGSGTQRVRIGRNGITVTVRLRGSRRVVRYGKTFFVWWTGRVAHPPTALKVTLNSILIHHADPNPTVADPSGANWVLNLNLNGYWQLLNRWAPRLTTHVTDGERIAVNRTVKIYVPRGAPVWLQISGIECDEPAGRNVLGIYANLLYPCPANTDELNPDVLAVFNNDETGIVLDRYRTIGAALGTHTSTSVATTNGFPGTPGMSFGNSPLSEGAFSVTYTVRRG